MKGNPALRTVLVLLLLAAVLYPVIRVISHGEHQATAPAPAPASPSKPTLLSGTLRIKTAPVPIRVEVSSGETVVLEIREPNEWGEVAKQLSLPPGSDLIVRAEWADDRPHALRAEFLPTGTNAPVSRDYWAERTLEDVLSLP